MKVKKIVLASVVALGMSGFAFADGITAQSGLYVNGQAGWSSAEAPEMNTSVTTPGVSSYSLTQSNDTYVLGAMLGYDYAFTQNWMAGLELGYLYMGYTNYDQTINNISTSVKLSNWGIQLMATGTYVMSSGWNIFGKVGGIYQETDTNGTLTVGSTQYTGSATNSAVIPALAVGVGYLFTQNLNLALQYEHTFGTTWNDNSFTSKPSSPMTQNIVTLGLTYKFPM